MNDIAKLVKISCDEVGSVLLASVFISENDEPGTPVTEDEAIKFVGDEKRFEEMKQQFGKNHAGHDNKQDLFWVGLDKYLWFRVV